MGWKDIEKVADGQLNFSSIFGKSWQTLNFMGRLLPIGLFSSLLGDEYMHFRSANTLPACKIFCFNQFQPINFHRFFTLQLLAVMVPRLIYGGYFLKEKARLSQLEGSTEKPIKTRTARVKGKAVKINFSKGMIVYNIVAGVMSMVLEMIFLYLFIKLMAIQNTHTDGSSETSGSSGLLSSISPSIFFCKFDNAVEGFREGLDPCNNGGSKWQIKWLIPRSRERKILLLYMVITTIISIVMIFLDIVTISFTEVSRKKNNKNTARISDEDFARNYVYDKNTSSKI